MYKAVEVSNATAQNALFPLQSRGGGGGQLVPLIMEVMGLVVRIGGSYKYSGLYLFAENKRCAVRSTLTIADKYNNCMYHIDVVCLR